MSISTMNDDLNILQNLAIPAFEEDVDVIQKLDDEPNDVGGLTAAELKAKFDEAGNRIKTYLNETLVPSISETVAEAEERAEAEAARVLAEEQRAAAERNNRVRLGLVNHRGQRLRLDIAKDGFAVLGEDLGNRTPLTSDNLRIKVDERRSQTRSQFLAERRLAGRRRTIKEHLLCHKC